MGRVGNTQLLTASPDRLVAQPVNHDLVPTVKMFLRTPTSHVSVASWCRAYCVPPHSLVKPTLQSHGPTVLSLFFFAPLPLYRKPRWQQ